jgi:hypothetical protein
MPAQNLRDVKIGPLEQAVKGFLSGDPHPLGF